jgi:hypothetical protein
VASPVYGDKLKKNPGVDPKLLAEAEKLRIELERLGVQQTPSYDLAPALGGTLFRHPDTQSEQAVTPTTDDA